MAYLGLETIREGKTAACVQDIFTLCFPQAKSVVDTTYGKGRFWDWPHQLKVYGSDIDPQPGAAVCADYTKLPYQNQSVDVGCFDPPFIFTPGINRIIGTKRFFTGAEPGEAMKRRWSIQEIQKPKGPVDLLAQTEKVVHQLRSITRQGIIIKGQDLIVNKPDWWLFNVMELVRRLGFGMPFDILIQHSKSHRMRDPRWKNQYHFRRSHCFYVVYKWA